MASLTLRFHSDYPWKRCDLKDRGIASKLSSIDKVMPLKWRAKDKRRCFWAQQKGIFEWRGKPGKYCILVKVIDIFGNDTSQAFDVEVPLS